MLIKWRNQTVYVTGFEPNAPKRCELCRRESRALRPFGPVEEWICRQCANLHPRVTALRMNALYEKSDFVLTLREEFHGTEDDIRALLDEIAEDLMESIKRNPLEVN
jgi:hypothetical protein